MSKSDAMKKIVLLLAFAAPLWAAAQDHTTGKITYLEKMKIELEGEAAQFAEMLKDLGTSKKELLFTDEATLYRNYEEEETMDDVTGDGMEMEMIKIGDESIFYRDLEANTSVEQRDFMGKKFLIEDDNPEQQAWKLTGEKKEIMGYLCQRAELTDSVGTIVAWYAPQIPVSAGPMGFGNLPGMILQIDMNDGELVITATEVVFEKPQKSALKAPKGGKSVTKEEYRVMVAEKMEEMNMMMGGEGEGSGSRVQIRIETN